MHCTHNYRDPSTTKYGGTNQRSFECKACEAQAALKKQHEELALQVTALQEQVKKLTATIHTLNYKFEMSRPLILR